jgi:hypothetical protein
VAYLKLSQRLEVPSTLYPLCVPYRTIWPPFPATSIVAVIPELNSGKSASTPSLKITPSLPPATRCEAAPVAEHQPSLRDAARKRFAHGEKQLVGIPREAMFAQ